MCTHFVTPIPIPSAAQQNLPLHDVLCYTERFMQELFRLHCVLEKHLVFSVCRGREDAAFPPPGVLLSPLPLPLLHHTFLDLFGEGRGSSVMGQQEVKNVACWVLVNVESHCVLSMRRRHRWWLNQVTVTMGKEGSFDYSISFS